VAEVSEVGFMPHDGSDVDVVARAGSPPDYYGRIDERTPHHRSLAARCIRTRTRILLTPFPSPGHYLWRDYHACRDYQCRDCQVPPVSASPSNAAPARGLGGSPVDRAARHPWGAWPDVV